MSYPRGGRGGRGNGSSLKDDISVVANQVSNLTLMNAFQTLSNGGTGSSNPTGLSMAMAMALANGTTGSNAMMNPFMLHAMTAATSASSSHPAPSSTVVDMVLVEKLVTAAIESKLPAAMKTACDATIHRISQEVGTQLTAQLAPMTRDFNLLKRRLQDVEERLVAFPPGGAHGGAAPAPPDDPAAAAPGAPGAPPFVIPPGALTNDQVRSVLHTLLQSYADNKTQVALHLHSLNATTLKQVFKAIITDDGGPQFPTGQDRNLLAASLLADLIWLHRHTFLAAFGPPAP
jgi:hypothetical protein